MKQAPKPDLAEKEEPRDIESPRKGTARSHVSEQQENQRIINSRKSGRPDTNPGSGKYASSDAEEYEDESEEDPTKPTYDDWLTWTKDQAETMAKKDDVEAQKRANYRLGLIMQVENKLQECLDYYQKVIALDPEFCKSQVALRIGEVEYKLNNIDKAFEVLAIAEGDLK